MDMDIRDTVLFAVCAYECAALMTDRIPTISSVVKNIRHRGETHLVVGGIVAYLLYHLLVEDF